MRFYLPGPFARLLAPALFLVACVLAFGLQIPWLGYYLDDWIILNAYNLGGGERLFEYAFLGNRPLVFWLWWIGFKLWGAAPIPWQVWALLWRWLTVVIVWLVWRRIWPGAKRQVTLAALLFAVYPLFKQQSSALTYSFHWICFFLYVLSLYWMILAVQRPRYFLPFMLGSVAAGFVQLFAQEFFLGLELLRPLVLWMVLRPCIADWKGRARRVAYTWAPYLILFGAYLVWRLALMPYSGGDRNAPTLLYGLFTAPLASLVTLGEMFFQDVVEMMVGVWYKTFQPDLFTARPLSNLLTWALVVATAAFVFLFLKWFPQVTGDQPGETPVYPTQPWYVTAAPFGLAAMLLGFAPGWTIERHIYDLSGIYNDRFGLAAMFGAALLLVALLEMLLKKERTALILACVLVGLGVGQNFRFATNYRWSWEKQRQLFWQLKWRAPDLPAPTAILGDGALISYMGSWATISALVQMYEPYKDTHFMDYWYFDLQKMNGVSGFTEHQEPFRDEKNFMRYRAPSENSLVIYFEPEKARCLWVLSEQDRTSRYLSEAIRDALPLSNPERIGIEDKPIPMEIFGPELTRDWCYYYQKADLASWNQDWQAVTSLWGEAEAKGEHPYVGVEYRPFIEGFAHVGDWDTALALTKKAYFPDYEMRDYLCETWQRIERTTEASPGRDGALQQLVSDYGCADELGSK